MGSLLPLLNFWCMLLLYLLLQVKRQEVLFCPLAAIPSPSCGVVGPERALYLPSFAKSTRASCWHPTVLIQSPAYFALLSPVSSKSIERLVMHLKSITSS